MFLPTHRYDDLPPIARRFARVPRYARLISMLNSSQLRALRTEADLFWFAFSEHSHLDNKRIGNDPKGQTGIIDDFLRTEEGKKFGWHATGSEVDLTQTNYRAWQIRLAMGILGATAFEIMFGDSDRVPADEIPPCLKGTESESVSTKPLDRFLAANAYVSQRGNPKDEDTIDQDWATLQSMGAGGLRHFVFASAGVGGEIEEIRFNDISTQAFFAAYWACNYGDVRCDFPSLWLCVPDDFRETNEIYAEFWRFVAEMPEKAMHKHRGKDGIDKTGRERWCELHAPVFDPTREGGPRDSVGNPIRSNELICRAWMSVREHRHSYPNSWALLSKIRSMEFEEMASGKLGPELQRTARGLLLNGDGDSSFISLCKGEHENDHGVFDMGSEDPGAYTDEGPVHPVRLSHYRLHRYAVSNLEYELYDARHRERREFEDKVPSVDHHPVVNVNWWDSLALAIWIGELKIAGRRYEVMLPSEAQWEYACRAGSDKPFSIVGMDGESITGDHCNFDGRHPWSVEKGEHNDKTGTYLQRTIPVEGRGEDGRLLGQNAWGFSQMHGNVWEWVQDWYAADYYRKREEMQDCLDPRGHFGGSYRMVRGGSWRDDGRDCRSSYRDGREPSNRYRSYGFRLSAVPI